VGTVREVFAADDLPVAGRTEYWRHVLGDALIPLEPVGLPERLVIGDLGPVAVGELSHRGSGGARRTSRHIRRSDPELCKIDIVVSGTGTVEQAGRTARLRAGDMTLVDLSRPANWAMRSVRCVTATFPRAALPLRPDDLAQLTATRIPSYAGTGELLSALARRIPAQLDAWSGAGATRVGAAMFDLITVTLAERLDRPSDAPAPAQQRALLERIYAFIHAQLGDPTLSPETVAAAHFISVRYLHKLFETQETTVGDWIRRRRLEQCRHALLDPSLRGEPVSAIAARWGLTDPAHFSRVFRSVYGLAPHTYRLTFGRPARDER
jgi:AraC-like DNA-binding protein